MSNRIGTETFDQLGDRLKALEMASAGVAMMPGIPVIARLDGRAFKEDAEAPFFTEAYLYSLLGKDNARTGLARINAVRRAAGLD